MILKNVLIAGIAIVACMSIVMCKKSPNTTSSVTCANCGGTPLTYSPDSAGVSYYFPTAFTPNGDGINDIFRIYYTNLDTAASIIAIRDASGTEVYRGKIDNNWFGYDMNGKACDAGKYAVTAQLKTMAGLTINTCSCVTLLKYAGSCLETSGVTYYFPDQFDIASGGFAHPTVEALCK